MDQRISIKGMTELGRRCDEEGVRTVELKEGELESRMENGRHDRRRAGLHHRLTVLLRYVKAHDPIYKQVPSFLDMLSAAPPSPSPSTRTNKVSTASCTMDPISNIPILSSRHRRTTNSQSRQISIRVPNCAILSRRHRWRAHDECSKRWYYRP